MSDEPLSVRLVTALSYHQRGQLAPARAAYMAILADYPRCFDALHLLGILNADVGYVDEGLALIRSALAVDASKSPAHYSLASALLKKGDLQAALASLDRTLALQPDFADAWFVRGNVLQQIERLREAVDSYGRAIVLRPEFPEAFNNQAAARRALRQYALAHDSANRALALKPDYAMALNNRGLILLDAKRVAAAVDDFKSAVAIDAQFAEAWHNLGTAFMQMQRFDKARDVFAELLRIAPHFKHAQGNLLFAKLSCCDWSAYEKTISSVELAVSRGEHAALPVSFLSVCGSASLQLRCAATYAAAYFPPSTNPPPFGIRNPARSKIRVAYLSGDFGEHAVTYLLNGVFERHDPQHFETIALSWDRRGTGQTRRRVESAFSQFIDVTDLDDAQAALQLRELEVDIAVDLMGHTLGQRTGILARRAAPIQVNYLGLPATMGASYIDYLIADHFTVPEHHGVHYAERMVRLPRTFQPNDDAGTQPLKIKPRSAYRLPSGAFVFCCFNRNNKLLPQCFEVWMRLLKQVAGSVLWLLATNPAATENLRRHAAGSGVDPSRLIFVEEEPYATYLGRYAHADLFLDTTPFNGGATVSDAVSMGVPVLTCAANSFASRMAGSILTALQLPQLVVYSLNDYFEQALQLATDPALLGQQRETLAQRGRGGFFDTNRYRLELEAAYSAMWQRHTAGLAAADITIPALPD